MSPAHASPWTFRTCTAFAFVYLFQTACAAPFPLAQPQVSRHQARSDALTEWARVAQSSSAPHDETGIDYWGSRSRKLLMINGTAEDTLSFVFYPEQGKTAIDYDFVFLSNNSEIVDSNADVSFSQTVSGAQVNITTAVDFNKFPGKVQLRLEARRLADNSLYDSTSFDFLAAGLGIFLPDTRTLVSGAGRSFRIPSYEDVYKKSHWDLGVFVQYLNGTDSLTILETRKPADYFSLSDINSTFMSYSGQILWDSNTCSVTDGEWDGLQTVLKPDCGLGFAVGYVNDNFYDGFHFAYDFQKNRAGRLDLFFEWERFTEDSEFEDEMYTTYLLSEIAGTPPAVVRRVEPNLVFSKYGGEELYVEMFNTADADIISFDVSDKQFFLVPGSRSVVSGPDDFYETATFRTEAGTGKKLPWTIRATRTALDLSGREFTEGLTFVDESGFLFSYDDEDILVEALVPKVATESGGEPATLMGKFTSFNTENPSHNVIIGNIPLDKSLIRNSGPDTINFTTPPRFTIGAGWSYDVLVQIGNTYSNPQKLEYAPSSLSVRQQVFGASSDLENDIYTLSYCGNSTYVASLEGYNGVAESYQWKILTSDNMDLLLQENASTLVKNTSTFKLPSVYLPEFDTLYKVVAQISAGALSTSTVFLVKRSHGVVVGVTLVQPENRTMSYPLVNMRVVAKVELPDCYPDAVALSYEWEYENKLNTLLEAERNGIFPLSVHDASLKPQFDKCVFPHNGNCSEDGSMTTTRLGRELYVRRDHLSHGVHRVRLTVKSENFTGGAKLFGVANTAVRITESPLRAVIGSGQISRKASDADDMYVSGQGSFDPDVISKTRSSVGLSYEWECKYSMYRNFSEAKACGADLLPNDSQNSSLFKVTKESLQKYSNLSLEEDEGEVYLRYYLTVHKGARYGTFSQVVALVKANGRKLATYERVDILNSRGQTINCDGVEFWEDLILSPVAPAATDWRFRLEYPLFEKAQFFSGSDRLIESPGYYTSTGTSAPGFQRLPLGIKADKLRPHQEYIFSVTLQEPGSISEEIQLCLKTLEVPELVFPEMQGSNGTIQTVFRATATTSFHANSSYTYQFYLLETEKSTKEYCVDGCTGSSVVRFQVPKPGSYVLQCRLLAANGRTLLAIKNNTAPINVKSSSSISQVENFDKEMDKDYRLGDDGAVNQKGFYVTQSMYEQDGQVVALSDNAGEEGCVNYTRKWAKMSRSIIGNDLPNTANARNYVSLASNFARLRCVEEAETLYELLGMVDASISRTPQEETLTTVPFSELEDRPSVQLEQELVRFYNFSRSRVLSSIAAGSSRGRLVPIPGEVNNLVLDLSELWMKHITTSATSGRVCGWDATYTSSSEDGEPDRNLASSGSYSTPLGVSTIRVAVMCNKEQGSSLSTPYASFSWCDSIYDMPGDHRKLITVAESFDYPYLSGVQGMNASDSNRLVMVDITTLGESNKLVSAMSDGMVLAQAESDSSATETSSCYRITLTMGEEAMTRSDECSENVPYHMWPRKRYGNQLREPFESGVYQRRTIGVRVTAETRNDSRVVAAQSNILGLYGAYRTTCSQGLLGTAGSLAGHGLALGGILLGIMVALLILIGLTYTFVSNLFGVVGNDELELMLENYVERDFFGRGQVRLNFNDNDDAASVSSSETGSEGPDVSVGDMGDLEQALEEEEGIVPDHSKLLAATLSNLPERPPS